MSWHVNTSAKDKAEARSAFKKAAKENGQVPDKVMALVGDMITAIPGPATQPVNVVTYGHFDARENGTSSLSITISNEPAPQPDADQGENVEEE